MLSFRSQGGRLHRLNTTLVLITKPAIVFTRPAPLLFATLPDNFMRQTRSDACISSPIIDAGSYKTSSVPRPGSPLSNQESFGARLSPPRSSQVSTDVPYASKPQQTAPGLGLRLNVQATVLCLCDPYYSSKTRLCDYSPSLLLADVATRALRSTTLIVSDDQTPASMLKKQIDAAIQLGRVDRIHQA